MQSIKQHPFRFILLFYFICYLFRAVEYLVLRTDQGVFGEAFVHKLIGILLLAITLALLHYKWHDIGFKFEKSLRGICIGLLFGAVVFTFGYGVEMLIQHVLGNAPVLRFYTASYAITGNRALDGGLVLFVFCIVGNLINVVMEEGVFRGLFLKLGKEKYSFAAVATVSALLFGFWHIAQPVRNIIDGEQSVPGAVMAGMVLVVTSALLGMQYAMLFEMTGSLWIGLTAHFFNNTSANLLHVETVSGVDTLLSLRIAIAQSLSFAIVLIVFLIRRRYAKKAAASNT